MNIQDQLENVGTFFAQVRETVGVTQRELGDMIKGSQATVTKFEKAQADFKFGTLLRMADALGYSVELYVVNKENGERLEVKPIEGARFVKTFQNRGYRVSTPSRKIKKTDFPRVNKPRVSEKIEDATTEAAKLRARFGI